MILQLNQDTNDFEATSMEFALIKTLGLEYLTNKRNSTPYGVMREWNDNETSNFGHISLLICLNRLLMDSPQEIFYDDLIMRKLNITYRNPKFQDILALFTGNCIPFLKLTSFKDLQNSAPVVFSTTNDEFTNTPFKFQVMS